LAQSADVRDRAKAAELSAVSPDVATLARLLRDADARVRANAAWSLGFAPADASDRARAALSGSLKDAEAAVVGNAAVSLGRLARGRAESARAALCGAPLRDARASVREQALRGLALAGAACEDGRPGQLLAADPRGRVRRAAAELLLRTNPGSAERRLLARCEDTDPLASVADACAGAARPSELPEQPVTVLVVPSAGAEAVPGAAFALLWADGGLRLGSADRRGAVHEPRAPEGPLELLPYAGGD
jgi:hypothetical protein